MLKVFLLVVAFFLPLQADAESGSASSRLLVFGDSLSAAYGMAPEQGWVAALAARLEQHQPPWQVINVSLSGETTAGGVARLAGILARHNPALVILELGGNDGLQGLALGQTRANLERMINQIRTRQARLLLLGMRLPPNYGPIYTDKFQSIFTDLAQDMGLAYVPFFLDGVATVPALMQADGIHPRAEAQVRLLDNLWPELNKVLESAVQ